jgi:DNA-binding transcriptional LysR family regulator
LTVRFPEGAVKSLFGQDATASHVLESRRSQALRAPPQQDLADHNYINVRVPTYGGLYAWEFEKGKRELKVRVNGQLVFNNLTLRLNAALAGFGLAYLPEDAAKLYLGRRTS